jgi:hypothetical protein
VRYEDSCVVKSLIDGGGAGLLLVCSCSVSIELLLASQALTTEVLLFSYLPPTIDLILPSTMDADGQSVSVRGSNFGREQVCQFVRPPPTPCSAL